MDKACWKKILISPATSLIEAMQLLNSEALRILLVINENQQLVGVVTDGDLRRHLLKQGTMNATVDQIMNTDPKVALNVESREQMLAKMQNLKILQLPIIDKENKVVGLETLSDLSMQNSRDNAVVIMAGGIGERLRPLTQDCPKPLLKVGNKPILEILLENCIKSGFKNFYFSVNYKADMIRSYFGNGNRWGVSIRYIEEIERLGTAGSLSLLPVRPDKPFFVVNADIVTNMNFDAVLRFHESHVEPALATVCVKQQQSTIPYGVVDIHDQECSLMGIQEKPTRSFFINAGIYVLNPEVLDHLKYNHFCDMPNFLLELVKKKLHVSTFPIYEYWLDVGHHETLIRADAEYSAIFS